MIPFFNLQSMNARHRDALIEATTRVIDRGWYIRGVEDEAFEKAFSEYTGVSHAIGVGNGLDALILIIRAYKELGVMHDGDEIIVASNAYIATVLAITENNLTPIFVEPDPQTHNLDTEKIEAAVTSKTKGIIALHLYGRVNFDGRLLAVAQKYGLKIIEDGAQAAGALWEGKKVGALGDACGMSLYPTKNLGALGDAGVVLTNDTALAQMVRTIANYGSEVKYKNLYQGVNSRLDEMQAAVLQVKLAHLDSDNEARRVIAERYMREIQNPIVRLPKVISKETHVWHLFVVEVTDRDAFILYLTENGIETLVHYPIPVHKQEAYAAWNSQSYPIAEQLAQHVVSLPLYPTLTEEEIQKIIAVVNAYPG
jgi:dTDP-4-amino-4,6-dideoxygalactose transaminase